MRYVLGFVCVLALGLMGCSETAGSDCTDAELGTQCTIGDVQGLCFEDECLPTECEGLEEGTECLWPNTVVGGVGRGSCEGGTCTTAVEDCTGLGWGTPCRSDGMMNFICVDEQCAALDCSELQDGTVCNGAFAVTELLYACEAGECVQPEDCTGIADGVLCDSGEVDGSCVDGECVPDP